jgi:hypothetical protein
MQNYIEVTHSIVSTFYKDCSTDNQNNRVSIIDLTRRVNPI